MNRTLPWPLPLSVLGALVLTLLGCSRSATQEETVDDPAESKSPQAHLEAARESLSKGRTATLEDQAGLVYSGEAVNHLNRYLKALKERQPSFQLKAAERSLLRRSLHLNAEELAEVQSPVFTRLDAHYLDFCFHLAEVARSLDLEGLPALERARRGFAWVIRQVTLKERVRQVKDRTQDDDLLPPQVVLQRGRGTARERALLFLALLPQLNLDGGLIACPGKDRTTYWIPAVLIDRPEKDRAGQSVPPGVYLFDTRLGMPLPGPGGKGVATLEQVRKSPDAWRTLLPGPAVIPEQIGTAEVRLACPLSAVSPRMRFLQKQLRAGTRVVLALDPARLRARFHKAGSTAVGFWSAERDPNTPTRVLRANLPLREGGVDRTGRLARVRSQTIPWQIIRQRYPRALQENDKLAEELGKRVIYFFFAYYFKPRSYLLRGRFDNATTPLVECQHLLARSRSAFLDETRTEEQKKELWHKMEDWSQRLRDAQVKVIEAQEGGSKRAVTEAQNRVAEVWKKDPQLVELIIYYVAAQPLGKETSYLLCLCLQEKAERFQARLDRALTSAGKDGQPAPGGVKQDALNAWRNADNRWQAFTNEHGITSITFKGRWNQLVEAVRRGERDQSRDRLAGGVYEALMLGMSQTIAATLFRAHALDQAGRRDEAIALLEKEASDLAEMEKAGHLDRLKQFVREYEQFRRGTTAYTPYDNSAWLKTAVLYQLRRLKKAD